MEIGGGGLEIHVARQPPGLRSRRMADRPPAPADVAVVEAAERLRSCENGDGGGGCGSNNSDSLSGSDKRIRSAAGGKTLAQRLWLSIKHTWSGVIAGSGSST